MLRRRRALVRMLKRVAHDLEISCPKSVSYMVEFIETRHAAILSDASATHLLDELVQKLDFMHIVHICKIDIDPHTLANSRFQAHTILSAHCARIAIVLKDYHYVVTALVGGFWAILQDAANSLDTCLTHERIEAASVLVRQDPMTFSWRPLWTMGHLSRGRRLELFSSMLEEDEFVNAEHNVDLVELAIMESFTYDEASTVDTITSRLSEDSLARVMGFHRMRGKMHTLTSMICEQTFNASVATFLSYLTPKIKRMEFDTFDGTVTMADYYIRTRSRDYDGTMLPDPDVIAALQPTGPKNAAVQ